MSDIENKATDAVTQYEIAKRQGDKMQICVQAGFVTAAFLQAKDEKNYREASDSKNILIKSASSSRISLPIATPSRIGCGGVVFCGGGCGAMFECLTTIVADSPFLCRS